MLPTKEHVPAHLLVGCDNDMHLNDEFSEMGPKESL